MRPPPPSALLSAAVRLPLPEPPLGLQDECDPYPCRWHPPAESSHQQPPSASADFEANAIMVLIVLLCALICALALHGAIRCFLRGESPPRPQPDDGDPSLDTSSDPGPHKAPPALPYSAGLGLPVAECAICLTEFEEGDGVRVLERCRHGFHSECIERWLCSRSSCPNCRRSCLPPPAESPSPSESTELRDRTEDCRDGGARRSREEEAASSSGQP